MDNIITKEMKTVEISEVDYMRQYQLCHLFNRFATIATDNAIKLGMWNESMFNHYGWVVAKQTLTLDEPIMMDDTIELSTIVARGSFVAFPRYYFIKKNGQEIGRCSSVWTLIDIQNRRIVSPKRIGISIPEITHEIHLETPKTIQTDIALDFVMKRQVLYSDVDTNQHMNNTRYIQWSFDIIDYQIHEKCFVKEISINYKKEIRPLEYVELYLGKEDFRYVVEGRNANGDIYFTIEIYFVNR